MNMRNIFTSTIVVVVFVVGVYFLMLSSRPNAGTFSTVSLEENCLLNDETFCDEMLVTIDEEGESIVVIENISKLLREKIFSQDKKNNETIESHAIDEFYFPDFESDVLIFKRYKPATSGCCTLYSYNVSTGDVKQLNHTYSSVEERPRSKSGRYIAEIGQMENELYVIDVLLDSRILFGKLSEGETFARVYSDYSGGPIGTIEWIGESGGELTIKYGVYDATVDPSNFVVPVVIRPQIDTRTSTLSSK